MLLATSIRARGVAGNALPIAEFEFRFDNADTDDTTTTTTSTTMGWPGKKQNSWYNANTPDYFRNPRPE